MKLLDRVKRDKQSDKLKINKQEKTLIQPFSSYTASRWYSVQG
ncbi:hypothetical protein [Lysinibacillus sphaericus]|nr:hypothetical protein [Lysinibacillus sphaericus]